jgi:sigma-B regulation protein RsbU (phosphoserine phosphatase)
MFFGMPVALSGQKAGHWLGVVIGMPWIETTLRGLSGFDLCVPVFINDKGEYVIFPPGRAAGQGPQSIFEDAARHGLPGLAELGRRMTAGERGLRRFADGLETSGKETVWPLPWTEPSTLIFYPMTLPGWRFAMAVPDGEIGNDLPGLPLWLLLLGLLGPALLGAVTWHATSRTLGPLRELAEALENLGNGDLDTSFPSARRDDETGRMLDAFERMRIILKASFRSQVLGATAQQRIRNELALARSIQEAMLPVAFPAVPGMDVAARVDMARDVCGDLYDCFLPDPARPGLAACVVGDVCGKGISAALVMSRVMPLARSALLRGLSPALALEQINTALLRQDGSGMFVTLLIGLFDSVDGSFTWACAGHPPPLPGPVPGEDSKPGMLAWANSLILGVKTCAYAERTLRLAPGQSLLLYTDGASEAMGPEPGLAPPVRTDSTEGLLLYGEERLASSFAAACRTAAKEETAAAAILGATRRDILAHMAGVPPFDDISFMVLRRRSENR